MSFDKAYEAVGNEVNLGPEAVKIRRFKVERMLERTTGQRWSHLAGNNLELPPSTRRCPVL